MEGELPSLNPGDMIKNVWKIGKKLGEGGFGAVYLCEHTQNGTKGALKLEDAKCPIQVLKMEVVVLTEVTQRGGRHVCAIYDKGRNELFNYVIMTLVGQSLQDLRKACPGSKFSIGCALRCGIQCLEAIEDLHRIGYLHRDVKPGNYAIGREEEGKHRNILILDFGLARKFISPNTGKLRTPRAAAGFRGTVRYAPLNCHNSRELSRKDDLETWFYQQIEITKGKLPWAQVGDKDEVARRTGEMVAEMPRQYAPMINYIDGLKYWDTPDYEMLYNHLRQAMQEKGAKESDPYDWEKGGQARQATMMLPAPGFNPHAGAPVVQF